jgi:hypothetical protein
VRELASQATDMARRNPMLFIGGAAIAGFAAARFLKARDPQPHASAQANPWAAPSPTSRGYRPEDTGIKGARTDA